MVRTAREGPPLPQDVALAIKAQLDPMCQLGHSVSGTTLVIEAICPDGERRLYTFGTPLDRPVSSVDLAACLRRFGLSDTGTAKYLFQRL